jgi:hypothetical protein
MEDQSMIGKARVLAFECRGCRYFLLALVGFLVMCGSASAQTASGRIIGTVTDEQGAAIADAKVTVTNTGTNVRSDTVTNADGFYQVCSSRSVHTRSRRNTMVFPKW